MRILLADDQSTVRSAMRLLLEDTQGLSVVGEAVDAEELLASAREVQPDLVLLDWELPGPQPASLVSALRSLDPRPRVIALSGLPGARRASLVAGVDAFVSKGEPPEKLVSALRRLGAGRGGH